MKCWYCKEHLDVGDACVTEPLGNHTLYFHIGCRTRYLEESYHEKMCTHSTTPVDEHATTGIGCGA